MKISSGGFLTGLLISDALSTPLDGLKKGHIQTNFKDMNSYVDPLPALKGKEFQWKKPALYSAVSQMAIIIALRSNQRRIDMKSLINTIYRDTLVDEHPHGIFRYADRTMGFFLDKIYQGLPLEKQDISIRSGYNIILPAILYISFPQQQKISVETIVSMSHAFTSDISTLAGSIIFFYIIKNLNRKNKTNIEDIISVAIDAIGESLKECQNNEPLIFNLGINPDRLTESLKDYQQLITEISATNSFDEAEKTIVKKLNSEGKDNITRPTIDNPLASLTTSLALLESNKKTPEKVLFKLLELGGAIKPMALICGSMVGAIYGEKIFPDRLKDQLINKKKIFSIVESISKQKGTEKTLEDFYTGEKLLTQKATEEYNARQKNSKGKTKSNKKSYKSREEILNRHVVESWTKTDRAKWKKERKKMENNKN